MSRKRRGPRNVPPRLDVSRAAPLVEELRGSRKKTDRAAARVYELRAQGYTHEEIAEKMDVDVRTAYRYSARMRKVLTSREG